MKKVFLISPSNEMLIPSRVLNSFGYELHLCFKFSDSIKILNEISPSVILLDFMFVCDYGMSIIQELINKTLGVPVIIISNDRASYLSVQAIKSGASDFVQLPCNIEFLIKKIELYCVCHKQYESNGKLEQVNKNIPDILKTFLG